jgi:hypothetical protein
MNNLGTAIHRGVPGIRLLCSVLILAGIGTVADSQELSKASQVAVRVVKIYDSPKIWSGVISWVQSLDVVVAKSSIKAFSRGQKLHLDVALVKGHALIDPEVPKFSSKKVRVDGVLMVKIGPGCLLSNQSVEFAIDPTCIGPTR